MALVDYDYRFIYADVDCQGRINDGGVFTEFYAPMKRNELNLPNPCPLEGTFASVSHEEIEVVDVPMVFVGVDAFPLTTQCMKSHSERGLEDDKRIFNYRISGMRRVTENAFGIWQVVFAYFLVEQY